MASTVAHPDPSKVIARTAECMRRLMDAGLTFDDLQTPIDDPDFRQRLVTFWRRGGIVVEVQETESQKAARAIMRTNFLGLPEVVQHFGHVSEIPLATLAEIPFSEETLRACAETHVLVADIGLSILNVRQKARNGLFYPQDWFNSEAFAQETDKACWRLIRKTPVDSSRRKTWNEQMKLIPDSDEVPSARQVINMIILHFLVNGERLLKTLYVRTSSNSSCGFWVDVCSIDRVGLHINRYNDYCGGSSLCVSSVVLPRKS